MKKIIPSFLSLICSSNLSAQSWKQQMDSAFHAEKSRQYQQALIHYNLAEKYLPSDSVRTITAISIYKGAGEACLRMGDFMNARIKLELASSVSESITYTNTYIYAMICERLARVYDQLAPENTEPYYLKAAALIRQLYSDSSLEYAGICNSLGNHFYNNARYTQAVDMHLTARKIRGSKLSTQHADYARSCNNLGATYLAMGEYEKAEAQVLEAKKVRAGMHPVNAHPDYAISCINLANIYRDMGQYEKAESLYLEAKNIRAGFEPRGNHPDYAACCNILGDLYAQTGKPAQAEMLYKEAMLIREKSSGKESLAFAESCNNLASLYSGLQKYPESEKLALTAKDIWDKKAAPDNPNHAINRNNLGELYFKMQQFSQSLTYYSEAGDIWKEQLGVQHPYYSENLSHQARVYNALGQISSADSLYKKSLAGLADQVERIFRFTSEQEKYAFLEKNSTMADEYFSFCLRHPLQADAGFLYNHILRTRGLILHSLVEIRTNLLNSRDTTHIYRYESWLDKKRQLASLYSSHSINKEKIIQLEEEINSTEKWLARQSAAFRNIQRKADWRLIRRKLKSLEAATEFVSFRYFNGREWTDSTLYAALIIQPGVPSPLMVPLFEKRQLDSITGNGQQTGIIQKMYSRGVKGIKVIRNSRPLYDIVWKPLEPYFRKTKKLYYTPAGRLFRISFAALVTGEQRLLSDQLDLVQCNSTEATGMPDLRLTRHEKLCLFGGVDYETSTAAQSGSGTPSDEVPTASSPYFFSNHYQFSYLPGTLAEVQSIREKAQKAGMQAAVLTGSNATEQSFKGLSGNNSPAVLHIATHGFFISALADSLPSVKSANHPMMKSGLLFSGAQQSIRGRSLKGGEDGIATALEISGMQLPSTKLIVLSACETALGDIQGHEGVYGLQRAFRLAGTDYLVMSLWEVPDRETAEFMEVFYDKLIRGLSIHAAFRQAQSLIKNRFRNQPEKWAAWILVR